MFVMMEDEALWKCGLLLKERICSQKSKFFPVKSRPYWEMGSILKRKNLLLGERILSFKNRPIEKGSKNGNTRVVSPESVSIHLKGGNLLVSYTETK